MKILMVCLGNICRSPMADGFMRKKVQEHKLDVYVDSAGTANYHVGGAPDTRMTETAKRKGILGLAKRVALNHYFKLARGFTPVGATLIGAEGIKKLYDEEQVIVLPGKYLGAEDNGQNPSEQYLRIALVHDI